MKLYENYYRTPCAEALQGFAKDFWPCNFHNKNGNCSLVMAGHSAKGHQRIDGRILEPGEYLSDFDMFKTLRAWNNSLIQNIGDIQQKLERKRLQQSDNDQPFDDDDEQAAMSELHGKLTRAFFENIGNVSQFTSHVACFSCLRELPEHPLPCGHVLCTPCVEACGQRSDKSTILLSSCPLHGSGAQWISPWEINIKPQYAGVRVLSLDG